MAGGLARTVLAATTGKVPGRAVYVGLRCTAPPLLPGSAEGLASGLSPRCSSAVTPVLRHGGRSERPSSELSAGPAPNLKPNVSAVARPHASLLTTAGTRRIGGGSAVRRQRTGVSVALRRAGHHPPESPGARTCRRSPGGHVAPWATDQRGSDVAVQRSTRRSRRPPIQVGPSECRCQSAGPVEYLEGSGPGFPITRSTECGGPGSTWQRRGPHVGSRSRVSRDRRASWSGRQTLNRGAGEGRTILTNG